MGHRWRNRAGGVAVWTLLGVLGAAACAPEDGGVGDDAAVDTTAAPTPAPPLGEPDAGAPPPSQLSAVGYGPVRAGMSLDRATAAAGEAPSDPTPAAACRYVEYDGLPGAAFMVVGDTVRRVDVRSADIASDRGARIGDTTDRVLQLHGDVERMPHKYDDDGEYLVVAGPDDTRLVFETDGATVTALRAGLMPQVLWVEGCS